MYFRAPLSGITQRGTQQFWARQALAISTPRKPTSISHRGVLSNRHKLACHPVPQLKEVLARWQRTLRKGGPDSSVHVSRIVLCIIGLLSVVVCERIDVIKWSTCSISSWPLIETSNLKPESPKTTVDVRWQRYVRRRPSNCALTLHPIREHSANPSVNRSHCELAWSCQMLSVNVDKMKYNHTTRLWQILKERFVLQVLDRKQRQR